MPLPENPKEHQQEEETEQRQQRPARILSIQSHVTSGYVGNKAAVFPLQLLGYDVDILNSCMLANHTGYTNGASGLRLSGADLTPIMSGLQRNGLLSQVTHVLTGYISSASFLEGVVETVLEMRKSGPLVYVCDPVLGDNGKLYVPEETVQVYIDRVIQHATIITPNAFELSLLAGCKAITSEDEAFQACQHIHDKHGVETIFVTGSRFHPQDANKVSVLVSSKSSDPAEDQIRFAVDADRLEGHFTGTGDLISALILAWTERLPKDLQTACTHAMASVTGVLLRTKKMPKSNGACPFFELRLIQSQEEILHPPINLVHARQFDT